MPHKNRKQLTHPAVWLLLCLLAAGCGGAKWETYSYNEWGFSISFPTKPEEFTERAKGGPSGDDEEFTALVSPTKNPAGKFGMHVKVVQLRKPSTDPEDKRLESLVNYIQFGKRFKQDELTDGGRKFMEVYRKEDRPGGTTYRLHFSSTPRRGFIVYVSGDPSVIDSDSAVKFLKSFRLLEEK